MVVSWVQLQSKEEKEKPTMKARLSTLLVLTVSIVLLGAGRANASMTTIQVQQGDYVTMSLGSQYYVMNGETGGEFGMTVYTDSSMQNCLGTFYTFCADPSTMMDLGVLYKVNAVADANYLGYQLSDYGKWIYYEYAQNDNGTLTTSYIPGHISPDFTSTVAGAIQEGIWSQLTLNGNGVGLPSGWDDSAYNAVAGTDGVNWLADYNNSLSPDLSSVGIAQLQLAGVNVQNQMVLTVLGTQGNTAVPEPATIIVWSLLGAASWLGMGVWRQRRGPVGRQLWSPENRQAIYEIVGRRSH